MTSNRSNSNGWPPSFRLGLLPVVGLLLAFIIWVMISSVSINWVFGHNHTFLEEAIWSIPSGLVQLGIVAAVYRYDGVTLGAIGLSRKLVKPATAAVLGAIIAVNAAVLGLAMLQGREISFGVYAFYRTGQYDLSSTTIAVSMVTNLVFTGAVEELAFRGYLQNKLVSLVDIGGMRLQTAVGIILAAISFSIMHIPARLLVDGFQVSEVGGSLVLLALSGMLFGTIYALTQNLWLVMFLHGVGNFWPIMMSFGRGIWPNYIVLLGIYILLILTYRQVTLRTTLPSPRPLGVAGD